MNETTLCILGLIVLMFLFSTGLELSFAMILVGLVGFSFTNSFSAAMNVLARDLFDVTSSYAFGVYALFMLMGQLAFNAGIAEKLYNTANKWVGQVSGGLAMATVVGATVFKAMCGSSTATNAIFASVAVQKWTDTGIARPFRPGSLQLSAPSVSFYHPAECSSSSGSSPRHR